MKTTVLDAKSVDEQMYTDASGEKKMQIGKGSKASQRGKDAVAETKSATTTTNAAGTTTKAAGSTNKAAGTTKTRLLQDATATNAG